MKIIRLLLMLTLTGLLYYGLDNKFDPMPPLGSFFNPFGGFWQNAEAKNPTATEQLKINGLQGEVQVAFDERLVPHIFAQNEQDLYFVQGYITAKNRLWQMEFISYAAAGRLSEILGAGENDQYIQYDLHQRRIGMVYAAEQALKGLLENEKTKKILDAYVKGVNAYIEQLQPKDYPIEYKILDYAPEKWTELKTALLFKYMAYDLSIVNEDVAMSNILAKYGKKTVDELFPNYPKRHDPIVPRETKWDFKPNQIPKIPKQISALLGKEVNSKESKDNPKGIGSNNWAISGEKSDSGYPILANDPHLSLSLPSIWFEIQLVTPDMNVYGVSLPGAPCVVIGFNNEVAWGVTNVESDVLDWYKLKFKEGAALQEYWHDNQWKKTTTRLETIKTKEGKTIVDTMYFTHHGPIVVKPGEKPFDVARSPQPAGYAMRWVAHDVSNELMTFYLLNKAKNYKDYRKALTFYVCPAQNFAFADVNNDIAITPNGKFPLKWKEQGKFLLDGSNPQHDWQGWIPNEHNPHTKNPARGFISSANQFSADTLYPYYLHWHFASYERGMRINDVLATMQKATYKTFIALQNDNLNLRARDFLPKMLSYINAENLKGTYKSAYSEMKKWDFYSDADKISPTIFKLWWANFTNATWEDDFKNTEDEAMIYPDPDLLGELALVNDSLPAKWFDDNNTIQKEDLRQILNKTFQAAVDTLQKKHGTWGDKWKWGSARRTNIRHLARIPGFSVEGLMTNGDNVCVNATTSTHGPSWRMVVALGRNPKGYGIYPGGQSGNPGSFFYANMIEMWRKGELAELLFMKKPTDDSEQIISRITFSKGS
ncbi:MAG: penicillin acylase family protein [Cytophagales bacterium]|nr:MAG: penicillin acylase family protein [Cytophagales bacterium]